MFKRKIIVPLILVALAVFVRFLKFEANLMSSNESADVVSLAFVGDVIPTGDAEPFSSVAPLLRAADISFANLESPLSNRGKPTPLKFRNGHLVNNEFIFGAPLPSDEMLCAGSFDVLSLANNHMMDHGEPAFLDTLDTLSRHCIQAVGAGINMKDARSCAVIQRGKVRVAFLAYVAADTLPGTQYFAASAKQAGLAFVSDDGHGLPNSFTIKELRDDIGSASRKADIVVVSFHWGIENQHRPTLFQRNLAHMALDMGANIIVGHHPHCLQGIEIYKGKPILYSMGNFAFSSSSKPAFYEKHNNSGIIRIDMDRFGTGTLRFYPVWINNSRPLLSTGSFGEYTVSLMHNLSLELQSYSVIEKQEGKTILRFDTGPKMLNKDATQGSIRITKLGKLSALSSPHSLVDVKKLIPDAIIDLRYATSLNVFKTQFYKSQKCMLRRSTALKLIQARNTLSKMGFRLKIWDAYRPLSVQRAMRKQVDDSRYVADPETGSNHNRGAAVDVTLVDRQGNSLDMGTDFDNFSLLSHVGSMDISAEAQHNRDVLSSAMQHAGFRLLSTEWWHFDDMDASRFLLMDKIF